MGNKKNKIFPQWRRTKKRRRPRKSKSAEEAVTNDGKDSSFELPAQMLSAQIEEFQLLKQTLETDIFPEIKKKLKPEKTAEDDFDSLGLPVQLLSEQNEVKLEPPPAEAPSVNPDPTLTGITWIVSLDLTDLPTAWSDIRVGVDHTKRLITPQGKFQQTITRPDGITVQSSSIWSKEISVPDIVELKPSTKFHNNVLKIECDLKPEFRTVTSSKKNKADSFSYDGKEFLIHETTEEESLHEERDGVETNNDPNAMMSTIFKNSPTFSEEEEVILENAYSNHMNQPNWRLDDPPGSFLELVKSQYTLNKKSYDIIEWVKQRNKNENIKRIETNKGLLERQFENYNFPKYDEITQICDQTRMSRKSVLDWFRSRRMKAILTNLNSSQSSGKYGTSVYKYKKPYIKTPHKRLEPPTTKAPSFNSDPILSGNTSNVSLNLADLPTAWSDIKMKTILADLNSSVSSGKNDSSGNTKKSPSEKDNEKLVADTETVKIEVMEEDNPGGVNLLEDDSVKFEHLSDEDDQPLTEALAREMES